MFLFSMSPGILVLTYILLICDACSGLLIKSDNFIVIAATFSLTSLAAIITLLAILIALKGTQIISAYKKSSYLRYFMMIYGLAVVCLIINLVFCGLYFLSFCNFNVQVFIISLYFTNIFQVSLVIFMISALAYNSMKSSNS